MTTTHYRKTMQLRTNRYNEPVATYKTVTYAACTSPRSRRFVITSENQAEVDCLRCAKKVGFEPKAKAVSANPTGTCQICFGGFKVKAGKNDLIALHGFQRPGVGYLIGDCFGSKHLPFEFSCETTKSFVVSLQTNLAAAKIFLAKLQADEVDSLNIEAATTTCDPRTYRSIRKMVEVKRGDQRTHREGFQHSIPSFEEVRRQKTSEYGYRIKGLITFIADLDEKIQGWVKKDLA